MILLFHFSIILPGSTLCNYVLHTLSSSAAPHPVVVRVHRIDGLIYASFTWRYNVQTVRHHDKPPRGIIPLYRNHQSGEVKNDGIQKNLETLSIYDAFSLFTRKPPKFPAGRWKAFLLKRPKFDLQPGMVQTSYEVWMPTVFIISKPWSLV